MKLQSVPDEIKKQWSLIKVATDYLKIYIANLDLEERNALYDLIASTLHRIDSIFGMCNISIIAQNECVHSERGCFDDTIIITGDNPRMFKCRLCGKHFQINAPTPPEISAGVKQICEFIRTSNASTEIFKATYSLELLCLKYKEKYEELCEKEKCTNAHNTEV